jgi:hypothetical protein
MKKVLKLSAFIFIVTLLFWACGEKEEAQLPYLSVAISDQTQVFEAEGGEVGVLVRANVDFTVASSAGTWCAAAKGNTNADGVTLTLTVNRNESEEGRTAKVTLSASGLKSIEISVTQAGIHYPLELTSFEPATGGYTTEVTLTGENFGDITAAVKVYFNNKLADVIEVNNTTLKARVPKGPGEECTISVVVGGDSLAYEQKFIYKVMPFVYTIANASSSEYMLPGPIAADESNNIVFVNREGADAVKGFYRLNLADNTITQIMPQIEDYDPINLVYMQEYGKYYALCSRWENTVKIISIDKTNWTVEVHNVQYTGASNGWVAGLAHYEGNLYLHWYTGPIIRVNPTTWTSEVAADIGDTGDLWGFTFSGTRLYFGLPSGGNKGRMGYIDMANPSEGMVWLTQGTGYFDGPFETALFAEIRAMCSNEPGKVYVADQSNHAIRLITYDGVSTFAGGNDWGGPEEDCDGTALAAKFGSPSGICFAPDGTMYIGDTWGKRIRKIVYE